MVNIEEKGIVEIRIDGIDPFPGHPYLVVDNHDLSALKKSVSENGIISPVIVRPKMDGRYELISGHRRKRVCELLGWETIPSIVVNIDDDAATIMMVESNRHRKRVLPSEKAKAYSMQYEALKRQRIGSGVTSGNPLRSDEILARKTGESRSQIHRYLKLSKLIPELLSLVDEGKLAIRTAVVLSELSGSDQGLISQCYCLHGAIPTERQADEIVSLYYSLSYDDVEDIIMRGDCEQRGRIVFEIKDIAKYFPGMKSKDEIKEAIMDLLYDRIGYSKDF